MRVRPVHKVLGQRRVRGGLGNPAPVPALDLVPVDAAAVGRPRLIVVITWALAIVLGAAAVVALVPSTLLRSRAASATATPAQVAEAQRKTEIIDLLQQHYFRPVDVAALQRASLVDIPRLLADPYTHYLDPQALAAFQLGDSGRYAGIGVRARLVAGSAVLDWISPGGPAAAAQLRRGDVLVSADGHPVRGASLDAALAPVRGAEGTAVRLEVSRAGRPFLVVLRRAQVQAQDVSSELRHVAGVSVGYVQVVEFSDGVGQKARDAVTDLRRRGATRIVLDLRQNGGGLVSEAVALAAVFRPLGSTVLSESGQHFDATTYRTKASPADATVPVAVLVDDQTASAAEIVTGALQDSSRALVVGTRTFGKGVVQDLAPLQGGGALKYTMAEYLTPNGHHVNHVGITPDVTVQPATGGTGTDPVFDAAVQDLG